MTGRLYARRHPSVFEGNVIGYLFGTKRPQLLRLVLIAALLALIPPAFAVAYARLPLAPPQQEVNLLTNGGFEGTYVAPLPGNDNINVAAGWYPYWVQGSPEENEHGLKLQPEYKAAFTADFPYTRVRSGEQAQQYFHSYGAFIGGVLQQVTVPRNARLRLSVWGQAWSCLHYEDCPDATSVDPSPMYMRIGIDPTGGTDWTSANVVWSGYAHPYDAYAPFAVEATAQGALVTVYLYGAPEFPNDDNDVYWDDASLVALGPPPPTPRPTNTPGPSPTPIPSATPSPSPTRTERPATATRRPSATPSRTPAPPPTNTPEPVRAELCVSVFQDTNRDGQRQSDENGQTGVSVSLIDSANTLVATTSEAARCFELFQGSYRVLASLPVGLSATTPTTQEVILASAETIKVEIGSVQLPTPAPSGGEAPSSGGATLPWAIALGGVALAALVFVLMLARRRS
jgi:hypothetical protein